MKILCVCKEWNSRSVNFAHLLKYWWNDCISIWSENTTQWTLNLLQHWADKIIIFEEKSVGKFSQKQKIMEFFLEDIYKRPFNPELNVIAKKFLADNQDLLKNVSK